MRKKDSPVFFVCATFTLWGTSLIACSPVQNSSMNSDTPTPPSETATSAEPNVWQQPAQENDNPLGSKPTDALSKVSSDLLKVRELISSGIDAQQIEHEMPHLRFINGLPEIEVRLTALTPEIVDQMEARGFLVTDVSFEYARIYGTIDLMQLEQIASIPEVTSIYPNYKPDAN